MPYGNYIYSGYNQSYQPYMADIDKLVYRFLSDAVGASATGNTNLQNCLVLEAFNDQNLQAARNQNNTQRFITFEWDSAHSLNTNQYNFTAGLSIQVVYNIYTSVSFEDGHSTSKLILKKIIDALRQELQSPYTYQSTVDGRVYNIALNQTTYISQVQTPEQINSINYLTGVLTVQLKITRNT